MLSGTKVAVSVKRDESNSGLHLSDIPDSLPQYTPSTSSRGHCAFFCGGQSEIPWDSIKRYSQIMDNKSYKLLYFPARGRGEFIRLAFRIAGVEFEDCRIDKETWATLKAGEL